MKGTASVLLLLFFCDGCLCVGTDPCRDYTVLKNITNRDPKTPGRPLLIDDSKLTPGWYGAPGKWELLNRDPGMDVCGTAWPIFRREKLGNTSEVCLGGAISEGCSGKSEIRTKMCGSKEIYYLETSLQNSGFCFFNNGPCASNPCANGGTCRDAKALGYVCTCASGFTGRNCTGTDPCRDYTVLKNITNRDPKTPGRPLLIDDSKLTPGWYGAPGKWELLNRDPGMDVCGTAWPIFRREKLGNTSEVCLGGAISEGCSGKSEIRTKMCGSKEIYYLETSLQNSGFCFFNNGPCASNPCANGGTCRDAKALGYVCTCASGFTGRNCTGTDPCRDYTVLKNITNRDPKTPGRPLLIDDSKLTPGWYGAPGKWELLNRDPGMDVCGTAWPIFRREKLGNTSEVCLGGAISEGCSGKSEIRTKMCGSKEIYYLETSLQNSGFCFFNNGPCASNPCANGGTCRDAKALGYVCTCASGFTGRNCTGTDPCRDYTVLKNITNRDPKTPGRPLLIDDSKLTPGWYGAPGKWELLNRDPGMDVCGTAWPIFRREKLGNTSEVCLGGAISEGCSGKSEIRTKMCGSKEIYYLETSLQNSGFCFFNNGPCASNPCANGGTCRDAKALGYVCTCASGFTGRNCTGTDPCRDYTVLKNITNRDPKTPGRPLLIDDSKLTPGWYGAPGKWELLNRDPGMDVCGTAWPIFRREKLGNTSEVCLGGAISEGCSGKSEIRTKMCGSKEIYYLETSLQNSGFCFFNNGPCASNPCANGGTCRDAKALGYVCTCASGFTGRNCTGTDPCRDYTVLKNITNRDPKTPGRPLLIDDSKLTPGWYGAPGKWELLNRDPGMDVCGTAWPIFRREKLGNTSEVCLGGAISEGCSGKSEIRTKMCGSKEIYYLETSLQNSGFCFFNNGPCASNPCANGGTCRDAKALGYVCTCASGFTGRNCTATDPCQDYTVLKNITNRDPKTPGRPLLIDDSKLTPGWYGAPGKWELLNRNPGMYVCGTAWPMFRGEKRGNTSEMCLGGAIVRGCSGPSEIRTKMCGNKEIYYLETSLQKSGFCFFNNGPCASNPCANGGTCRDAKAFGYLCTCASGFTGRNCTFNNGPCASNPCANGGTCSDSKGLGYLCTCASGFTGRNCTYCVKHQDILIMEDVSRSIGQTNFDRVRQSAESLLGPFTISPDADNVAYMVFSTNARVVFSLREYSNSKSSVLAALRNQDYESGIATNIDEAIDVAVESVFTPSNGDRPNAANVVIMFTDGYDTETKRGVIVDNVSRLHATAEVFVVTLSNEASPTVNILASAAGNIFRSSSNATVRTLQARLKSCPILL